MVGMVEFPQKTGDACAKLLLLLLKPMVYSRSTTLLMILLSLYGLVHGVASVPRKRLSAVRSLVRYGADVLRRGLTSSTKA